MDKIKYEELFTKGKGQLGEGDDKVGPSEPALGTDASVNATLKHGLEEAKR